ncbi:PIN domain-like protein [Anaeromyces robustus]|uniref:PIN domain-like protein n=1 Tax=Anaeromyces robustus TaxID=1754192 RepID=A0A1Y1X1N1_9FUNG|nr:PIN domain-like protein [Anaeromyces robustus]|eukprot:ORX79244.1 PIN domain-like protein [Anaeromyces robustus]
MGVKKLSGFVTNNITLSTIQLVVNKKKCTDLCKGSKNLNEIFPTDKNSSKNDINLIIDANAFFYHLGNQLNWFNFDNLAFLKHLEMFLNRLISIDNLGEIFFVFDGMDTDMKLETIIKRSNERIASVGKFYHKIISSKKIKEHHLKYSLICATPLIRIIYAHYLLDMAKITEKVKVKFSYLEADAFIAKLVQEHDGYVISNDSDFYIYDIPGYIKLDTLHFHITKDSLFFKCDLYTSDLLEKYLGIPKVTLPIFATLCGNDYIKVGRYEKLALLLKNYKCTHKITNKIKNGHFKCISNLILDIYEKLNKKYENFNNKKKEQIQNLIIEELFGMINNETKDILEHKECQNKFKDSLNEYNLVDFKGKKEKVVSNELLSSYYSGKIFETLLNILVINHFKCTQYFENPKMDSCWNISQDIRKDTYEFLILRNYNKQTNNDKNKSNSKNNQKEDNYIITEYVRKNKKITTNIIQINNIKQKSMPKPLEERFNIYLKKFKSNNITIKKVPYFLIPVVISLRFYIITKIKDNLFITSNEKNNIFNKFYKYLKTRNNNNNKSNNNKNNTDDGNGKSDNDKNNTDDGNGKSDNDKNNTDDGNGKSDNDKNNTDDGNGKSDNDKNNTDDGNGKSDNDKNNTDDGNGKSDDESKTVLHYYEFEALLASCVASLTFTFLHKNMNIMRENEKKENEQINSSINNSSNYSIKENIKENYLDCNNMADVLKNHKNRCISLKNRWNFGDVKKDIHQYNNAIHIYAEFINLLIANSQLLQVLKITNDLPEFTSLFTMYHYLWEESFYFLVNSFKSTTNHQDITSIFTNLFSINVKKDKVDNYLNYLNDIYNNMLNAILIC